MKFKLLKLLSSLHAKIFGRPECSRFNEILVLLGLKGLGVRNYGTKKLSGEIPFTKSVLLKIDGPNNTILDVGANEGNFTQEVLNNSDFLNVVAVEPHPRTFERLYNRYVHNDRVTLLNIGAGDRDATLSLFDYSDRRGSTHASFFREAIEEAHHVTAAEWEVPVRKLDDVVSENELQVVFVKIDVEGFEFNVLKGLGETIRRQKVPYILIEFNEMNIYSGTFLRNFMDFLDDYEPFRILPYGRLLGLRPYRPFFAEIFTYQNIVFIRKELVLS
ncbi:MAG: FkbM family methyltransferase [Deltaproteobacteria bacterium]